MGTAVSRKKRPLWAPYVKELHATKRTLHIVYNGGECTEPWKRIHSILLYGSTCALPETFLEQCRTYRIPVCLHRRNVPDALWITPSAAGNSADLLEKQVLARANEKRRVHIAKRLLDAKFTSMTWLMPYPRVFHGSYQSVAAMRQIEAWHANEYWKRYYAALGCAHGGRRIKGSALTAALDAVSKLVAGVTLRWVIYHRLSPTHGFLHEPSDYIALCYDLMEPYRGYVEKAVYDTIRTARAEGVDEATWTARSIAAVEHLFDTTVYTDATRQLVTFQELVHGSVLALRAYLTGDAVRFMPPLPGHPNGGRPRRAGYTLFGRSAGPTDFWNVARDVAANHRARMSPPEASGDAS